jgi:PRC-barrel domain
LCPVSDKKHLIRRKITFDSATAPGRRDHFKKKLRGRASHPREPLVVYGVQGAQPLEEETMDATTETGSLISASKVNGTSVYNTSGDSIGKIYDVMLDKVSGKVAYAIMSFGGFLGIGDSYHPLPWALLKYDTNARGYVVNLTKQKLEGAPNYAAGSEPAWGDRAYDKKVYGYYDTSPFWS